MVAVGEEQEGLVLLGEMRQGRLQTKFVRAKASGSDDEIAVLRGLSLLGLSRCKQNERELGSRDFIGRFYGAVGAPGQCPRLGHDPSAS